MNILILSSYWPTSKNRISGIFVVQQVAALLKMGINITLVIENVVGKTTPLYLRAEELGLSSINFRIIVLSVMRFPEKLISIRGMRKANTMLVGLFLNHGIVRNLLKFGPFDGCIVHGLRYIGLSIHSWQQHVKGNIVLVIHGVDPFFNIQSNSVWASEVLARANEDYENIVIVGSPLFSHALSLGVPKEKIKIVPNGTEIISPNLVSNKQRDLYGKRIILSVSNLIKLKGIDLNLFALSNIFKRSPYLLWEYHIVGDGPEREALVELANKLGITDRVRFFGRIDYDETMQKIADADIFSLPSWGEAFGIVYLEAMMRMRPVIGCFENGAADIILNNVNGLLIPPKNIIALSEKLELLLMNPELCEKLGHEGRKTAEKFSCQDNAKKMIEVLGLNTEID